MMVVCGEAQRPDRLVIIMHAYVMNQNLSRKTYSLLPYSGLDPLFLFLLYHLRPFVFVGVMIVETLRVHLHLFDNLLVIQHLVVDSLHSRQEYKSLSEEPSPQGIAGDGGAKRKGKVCFICCPCLSTTSHTLMNMSALFRKIYSTVKEFLSE